VHIAVRMLSSVPILSHLLSKQFCRDPEKRAAFPSSASIWQTVCYETGCQDLVKTD
jgi:hypothetical protein